MEEKEAIERGKKRMRESKDPVHDYRHAQNVAEHGFKILESLKNDGWEIDDEVDGNLIYLCAFWHDCYKALFERKTFLNEIFEGINSAKIVEKELKTLLDEKRLGMVLHAVRNHNNLPYLLFSGKRMPILTRVLIEGDTIDAKNSQRKKEACLCPRSCMHRVLVFFGEPVLNILQKIYIKSSYAKCQLSLMNNKKKR